MSLCPRCGRGHRGVCGIPSIGVRIGIGGVGVGGARRTSRQPDAYSLNADVKPKPRRRRLTRHGLEEMLDWGMQQERKCKEMLKLLPHSLPEYEEMLGRLDRIMAVNEQVKKQLAERRR